MEEVLNLNGVGKAKAQYLFLKAFWLEFGVDGNKTYKSPKPKDYTLNRLRDIGLLVVFRKNDITKNTLRRESFNNVKGKRHSFKSHKICFACGELAEVRHHIIWIKNGGLNSKKNLVSLCKPCHAFIHPWLQNK
jgi:5-methylcytosine-specific restriction endonuclease McrA